MSPFRRKRTLEGLIRLGGWNVRFHLVCDIRDMDTKRTREASALNCIAVVCFSQEYVDLCLVSVAQRRGQQTSPHGTQTERGDRHFLELYTLPARHRSAGK